MTKHVSRLDAATQLHADGQLIAALAELTRELESCPGNTDASRALNYWSDELDSVECDEQLLRARVQADPFDFEAAYDLADVACALDRTTKAIELWKSIAAADSGHWGKQARKRLARLQAVEPQPNSTGTA